MPRPADIKRLADKMRAGHEETGRMAEKLERKYDDVMERRDRVFQSHHDNLDAVETYTREMEEMIADLGGNGGPPLDASSHVSAAGPVQPSNAPPGVSVGPASTNGHPSVDLNGVTKQEISK